MVNIEKIKSLQKEISQTHQELIKTLDSVELELLPVNLTQNKASKVAIDISIFEIITTLATQLYDKDLVLSKLLRDGKSLKSLKNDVKDLRRALFNTRRQMLESSRAISKDMKKVSLILNEFKERCRSGFVEFLKQLESDLRKTLKPLVPSEVLQEQINFRPIGSDPDLLSSFDSNNNEFSTKPTENTVDKLNNHIQLLVNTLEEVAKSLIVITQNTYRSYYELVDPNQLYSEPPSPLAAPLPEYFSYDIGNISEENRKKSFIMLTAKSKERIIQKFLVMHKDGGQKSPLTSRKVQEKLELLLAKDVKEADLLQFFKEEGIPVSEREKLVYEVINSERSGGMDVSLDDIINYSSNRNHLKSVKTGKSRKEVEDNQDLSLETFVEDRQASSINKLSERKAEVPPLNVRKDTQENPSKPRSVTPGKSKKDKKQGKRTKTPVLKKPRKS
jgi:hypothetical protein